MRDIFLKRRIALSSNATNSKMRGAQKVGHRATRRFLGQTALVVGGTGGVLFAAGAVYFRSRNASPIQHTEFPEAAGKSFVVTGGTSGIGEEREDSEAGVRRDTCSSNKCHASRFRHP